MARKKLTAQQKYLLKMQGPRPRQAPSAPKSAPKPVYRKPKGPGNPPGFGKTPPKAPPSALSKSQRRLSKGIDDIMAGGKGTFRARRVVNQQYARAGFAKFPNYYQRLTKTPPKGSVARAMQQVPLTRAGKALKAANLSGSAYPAASRALARATLGTTLGAAALAYDAYKALDAYSKTSGPKKQMAKYQSQGGFSHMTSNPKNRGKQGIDF